MVYYPKTCKHCSDTKTHDGIRSLFCTCHDSSAVMTCAGWWPDSIIRWMMTAIFFSRNFGYELINWLWNGSQKTKSHTSLLRITHDDVIRWKHFSRYWPFVRGIHRSLVNSPHKGQWRGALMFSLICVWINVWVNNCEAGDLRRHRGHNDVNVMHYRLSELGHIDDKILYSRHCDKEWLIQFSLLKCLLLHQFSIHELHMFSMMLIISPISYSRVRYVQHVFIGICIILKEI